MKTPMNTRYGYKLFETRDGKMLLPLFIDKNEVTPIGKWVQAKNIEYHPSFSHRPGWHVCSDTAVPDAPWLKDANGNYKSRFKNGARVWCLVEYDATVDYNDEVKNLPKKCFTDHVPENGFYDFRESKGRDWVITGAIKVVRILTEEERQNILKSKNYNEDEAYAPYKAAFEKRMKSAS